MKELIDLGFTTGEVSVYTTLLKKGPSTNGPLAREIGMQVSSTYYCLQSLIEKGYVKYVKKGNKSIFSAINPKTIPLLIDEEKEKLEKKKEAVVKALSNFPTQESHSSAEVYEGLEGVKTIFREILGTLDKGDEYQAFVLTQDITSIYLKNLFVHHNQALHKKGIKLRLLAPDFLKKIHKKVYGEKFLKSYQEMKYTKQPIPAGITLYSDIVIIHVPEERPLAIKIKNKKLHDMYKQHFDFLWKTAK